MNSFSVQVDLDAPEPTLDQLDLLMDMPAEYECSWGMFRNRLQAQLTVPAKTLRQAVELGILVAADAARHAGLGTREVVAVAAMTEGEFEHRQAEIPDLLSTEEVAAQLNISRQAVVKRAEKLGGRKVGDRAWVFDAGTIRKLVSESG
ncbi:hypothetical protein [Lentzea sp. NPDC092896]|uniref:hypothetical protein n=1 Tax=Lentzea sp. NPDC092896 TaxID=3364127 RepID=UPI0037F8A66D